MSYDFDPKKYGGEPPKKPDPPLVVQVFAWVFAIILTAIVLPVLLALIGWLWQLAAGVWT